MLTGQFFVLLLSWQQIWCASCDKSWNNSKIEIYEVNVFFLSTSLKHARFFFFFFFFPPDCLPYHEHFSFLLAMHFSLKYSWREKKNPYKKCESSLKAKLQVQFTVTASVEMDISTWSPCIVVYSAAKREWEYLYHRCFWKNKYCRVIWDLCLIRFSYTSIKDLWFHNWAQKGPNLWALRDRKIFTGADHGPCNFGKLHSETSEILGTEVKGALPCRPQSYAKFCSK